MMFISDKHMIVDFCQVMPVCTCKVEETTDVARSAGAPRGGV